LDVRFLNFGTCHLPVNKGAMNLRPYSTICMRVGAESGGAQAPRLFYVKGMANRARQQGRNELRPNARFEFIGIG